MIKDSWVHCDVVRRPIEVPAIGLETKQPVPIFSLHEIVVHIPVETGSMYSIRFAVLEPMVEDVYGLMVARCLIDLW